VRFGGGHAERLGAVPLAAFAFAVVAGAWLRARQLAHQIVAGDEIHALKALLEHSYGYLFTHFFENDICIPQTLIAKLVADTIEPSAQR